MENQEKNKGLFKEELIECLQNLIEYTPLSLTCSLKEKNSKETWSIPQDKENPKEYQIKGYFNDLWNEFFEKKGEFKEKIGIEITRIDEPNGDKKIVIRPSHYVGITTIEDMKLGNDNKPVYVIVKPKIKNANFLRMLNYAYNLKLDLKEKVLLEKKDVDFLAIFFLLFLQQLKEFIKHLRRNYIIKQESLIGKVKGKIMLKRYLQQSLPRFQNHIVACQFFDLTQDCLENRILKYTLYLINIFYRRFNERAQSILYPSFGSLFPYFSLIAYTRILLSDFERIRYVGQFKAYKQIHQLCKLIIQNTQIEESKGELTFKGFVFDMHNLFEKFIAGILRKEWGSKFIADKNKLKFEYDIIREYQETKHKDHKDMELDGLFERKEKKFVLDCKYKEVFEAEGVKDRECVLLQGGKIKNSDVFQVIAYGTHDKIEAKEAILVYPSEGQMKEQKIRTEKLAIPVHFVGIDITNFDFENRIKNFVKHIESILF